MKTKQLKEGDYIRIAHDWEVFYAKITYIDSRNTYAKITSGVKNITVRQGEVVRVEQDNIYRLVPTRESIKKYLPRGAAGRLP